MMYAKSFIPLLNRPKRVTRSSATFIDIIFTNNFQNIHQFNQGILVTEKSDHFLIFHINWNIYDGKKDLYFASTKAVTDCGKYIKYKTLRQLSVYSATNCQNCKVTFSPKGELN